MEILYLEYAVKQKEKIYLSVPKPEIKRFSLCANPRI